MEKIGGVIILVMLQVHLYAQVFILVIVLWICQRNQVNPRWPKEGECPYFFLFTVTFLEWYLKNPHTEKSVKGYMNILKS